MPDNPDQTTEVPDSPHQPDQAHDAVWVTSELAVDGAYILSIEFSDDVAVSLDIKQARAYGIEVLRAVVIAQYDAAVFRQFTHKLHAPPNQAAQAIKSLREDRPPLDRAALGPLSITPLVSADTGDPFLECVVAVPRGRSTALDHDGQRRWHWSAAEAREHAHYVLEHSNTIDLDSAYRRWLIAACDIEANLALQVVHDLGNFIAP